ncbi:MAG: hypothetical protein CSB48_07055 [Proteobacteria bacterium]|nr:MAG: hypothetical protein CSB48_07055 [Pseudomonadota bacterium]
MKRNSFKSEFKTKIAVETIKGKRTVNEIATEFEAYPGQVNTWKNQLLESSTVVFGSCKSSCKSSYKKRQQYDFEKGKLCKVIVSSQQVRENRS